MKGYYTVRLAAPQLSQGERIALETRYARELEKALGGPASTTELCLASAVEDGSGPARASLQCASDATEAALRACQVVPEGSRFVIEAWQARDL